MTRTSRTTQIRQLRKVVEDLIPRDHFGGDLSDAHCDVTCRRGDDCDGLRGHRPDLAHLRRRQDVCDAHPDAARDEYCLRCMGLEALRRSP